MTTPNPDNKLREDPVPVRLYERQYEELAHMDEPMSQLIREIVERALMEMVPGYASRYYKSTGTGFPELSDIDLYGDRT